MFDDDYLDRLGVPNAHRQFFQLLELEALEDSESEDSGSPHQLLALMLTPGYGTNQLEQVFQLLENGSDARAVDTKGNGAFHYAVCTDILKGRTGSKIRFRRPAASARDDDGQAMEKLFQCLQAAGADVNLQNNDGQTPLHLICSKISVPLSGHGHRWFDDKLFAALVKAGADVGVRDHLGRTPLFFHVESNSPGKFKTICKSMSQAGARLDVTDNNGRNLLHAAVSNPRGDQDLLRLKLLLGYGLDPNATDAEGNTLWHATIPHYASRPLKMGGPELRLYDLLLELGVDYRRPNNSGRTPLHEVSSLWPLAFYRSSPTSGETTAFDYILGLYDKHDVDPRDKDGITPLHLACTFSEYQAQRLLENGADRSKTTAEGLTALHQAARGKQGNIIGILLETSGSHASNLDKAVIPALINKKDARGRTALYYACASGRAESVRLLLDAGATVESDTYQGSVWQACVEFEEEQAHWPRTPDPTDPPTVGGVLLADERRPKPTRLVKFPSERLDDVLGLILARGNHQVGHIDEAISSAVRKQHIDYTVECLLQARIPLQRNAAPYPINNETSACLERRQTIQLIEGQPIDLGATCSPRLVSCNFKRLMRVRRYDLVETLLRQYGWGEIDTDGNTALHDLVHDGFTWILRRIVPLVREISEKLEDAEWCEKQISLSSRRSIARGSCQPLLLTACQSDLPNMETVRFLVEDVGCNVNAQGYTHYHPGPRSKPGLYRHETAAHCLVRGICHWWQVAEALPYLVRHHDADLEIKDSRGLTPLNAALGNIRLVTFSQRAVEVLIKLGADVKTADLTQASNDIEMTEFLLRKGAVTAPQSLLAAIKIRNCKVLTALLSNGGAGPGPNTRQVREMPQRVILPLVADPQPPPSPPRKAIGRSSLRGNPRIPYFRTPDPYAVPLDEMYPLDYAAHWYSGDNDAQKYAERCREHEEIIRVLVTYGADSSKTYRFPDGKEMSIMDRIVKRGRLVERISELCAAHRSE